MPDPIIAKTIRETTGLTAGGSVAGYDVLATYCSATAGEVFALCRDGLLLRQDRGWRYVANEDIEDVALPIREVKVSVAGRRLILVLKSGERIDVPVDGERDPSSHDIYPVYAWVQRRVHQHMIFSGRR
jgi:hypothetical protein